MWATLAEVKTLKPGDFIESSEGYYKVLGINQRGLWLTPCFCRGQRIPKGKWFFRFPSKATSVDSRINYWYIFRGNDPRTKSLKNSIQN